MDTTKVARLDHVEVVVAEDGIHVSPIWCDVDRPNVGGWLLRPDHSDLAARLVRAIEAGAACANPQVKVDNAGKTYVQSEGRVLGRRLNADLRRLGF